MLLPAVLGSGGRGSNWKHVAPRLHWFQVMPAFLTGTRKSAAPNAFQMALRQVARRAVLELQKCIARLIPDIAARSSRQTGFAAFKKRGSYAIV